MGAGVRLGQGGQTPPEEAGPEAGAAGSAAAGSSAALCVTDGRIDPYASSAQSRKRRRMPGTGMRLGAASEDPGEAAALQAAANPASSPTVSAGAAAQEEDPGPEEPASVDEILRAHGFASIRGGYASGSNLAAGDMATLGTNNYIHSFANLFGTLLTERGMSTRRALGQSQRSGASSSGRRPGRRCLSDVKPHCAQSTTTRSQSGTPAP